VLAAPRNCREAEVSAGISGGSLPANPAAAYRGCPDADPSCLCITARSHKALPMFKVIGWIVFIIFVIGLMVVTGLFKLVF
jgi:hypothetical protein